MEACGRNNGANDIRQVTQAVYLIDYLILDWPFVPFGGMHPYPLAMV